MLRKTHFEFDGIPNTLAQKEQKAGSASGPKKNQTNWHQVSNMSG